MIYNVPFLQLSMQIAKQINQLGIFVQKEVFKSILLTIFICHYSTDICID